MRSSPEPPWASPPPHLTHLQPSLTPPRFPRPSPSSWSPTPTESPSLAATTTWPSNPPPPRRRLPPCAHHQTNPPLSPRATEENALKDARITKPTLQRIKRARAATANGFETLALFAAGVVAANVAHVGLGDLNRLTLGYLATRTAYNFSYVVLQDNARLAVLRSVSWISSLYCIFSLFVKAGNAVN